MSIGLTGDFCLPVPDVTSVGMATAGTDSSSPHDPNWIQATENEWIKKKKKQNRHM